MKYAILFLLLSLSGVATAQSTDYDNNIQQAKELVKRNKIAPATQLLLRTIRMDTTRAAAYYELGIAYTIWYDETGEYGDSALFFLEHSLITDSTYGNIRTKLGSIKGRMHDFAGALTEMNIAEQKQADTGLYTSRGLLKYKLQDYDGACADFAKAIQIGSTFAMQIVSKKLIDISCPAIAAATPEPLYNIRFVKALNKGGAVNIIFVLTPKNILDFPPVVSTKIVYSTENHKEQKIDLLNSKDGVSMTLYDKSVKSKAPEIYKIIKKEPDVDSDCVILMFKFTRSDVTTATTMTMTYGCWEKRNNDSRVEKKYSFNIDRQ